MADGENDGKINVKTLGLLGVNVDKNPLELLDGELRSAQNAIHEPLGANAGIKNRPGLTPFNTSSASVAILGGVGVPFADTSANGGALAIYIGRGPTT